MKLVGYDFEVFKKDWLMVAIDPIEQTERVIINNRDQLQEFYEEYADDGIFIGYNNKHYDQYIFKAILLGMDPKEVNDKIIVEHKEGWLVVPAGREIHMINYDTMPSGNGEKKTLKQLEGFMGDDIRESQVDFNIDRKLTPEDIAETVEYCRHDVEETLRVFTEQSDVFNAMRGIVKAFPDEVTTKDIGCSEAQITAKVLQCTRNNYGDEFDYSFLPCLRIEKYKEVPEWFSRVRENAKAEGVAEKSKVEKKAWYKKQNFTTNVAGVPHTFGFGGLHGAPDKPVHVEGCLLHVDVNNYYPSMLIAHDLVTRSAGNENYQKVYTTRKTLKMQQLAATQAGDKAKAKELKNAQLPYKKMLNALSGAMKDESNPAYDPRNNNNMCINGQLMLLDLIEHLEAVPDLELIQSNTDGLIIKIPDTDEAFNMVDDICWEWERRVSTAKCSILLALDNVAEIFQKDVNNYLWIDTDGDIERKGKDVKGLSAIDYDLPIVNKAIVEYMTNKTPVEDTINNCDDFIEFQKIVKRSSKYNYVERETGVGHVLKAINHRDGTCTKTWGYDDYETFGNDKTFRVFASRYHDEDGRLLKYKQDGKCEKFTDTPDHCRVYNDAVKGLRCPEWLDKKWYIDLARKRLKRFGMNVK